MSGQCKARHFRQGVTLEPQDVDVAVDEICNIEVMPVRAERDAFGEAADIGLRHLADRLCFDLEKRHVGFIVPVEGGLGCAAAAVQDQRGGIAAGRADGEPFRAIADDYLIDDAGRARLEVDDANGVDPAVLAAADVVDDPKLLPRARKLPNPVRLS